MSATFRNSKSASCLRGTRSKSDARSDVAGLRIDVMSKMRGVDGFEDLWERRTTISVREDTVELMGLGDLVRAKKTQRGKDWPMIRRLVEQNHFESANSPAEDRIRFWLNELRTPELLVAVCSRWPEEAARISRPAIEAGIAGDAQLEVRRIP